ncbi:hypothetical protein [Pedobacter rhodius]|uniref:Uncharacterized protein n=1 Tax=Pedobacter rhodius TaxID=3004098 RepID=A0ABT4KVV1_9SPHI|nr:hypothetical protein [Pedobacter sp. SJ11]MCZ4223050.1 hypothetical protein [Pedobacter sp. SJ11]
MMRIYLRLRKFTRKMDKVYELRNCEIKVRLDEGLIRVYSDKGLWCYLDNNIRLRTLELAKFIKIDYQKEVNKTLMISESSLMVEIWAHVYSDYFGLLIKRHLKIKWVQNLLQKGIERAEIIDCGEKKFDSNRWVWDFLSHFEQIISLFLPKNISNKNLKN